MQSNSTLGRNLEAIVIPIAALLFSLVLFGIFCALYFISIKHSPLEVFGVYGSIYKSAFGNSRSWQNTLVRAAPLMLTSMCTALPARLGLVIIGNEGALVMGGIGSIIAGLALASAPAPIALLGMLLGAILFGGIWIAIVGALRHYRAVNETISSLLMNYIAIALLNHLVNGPPLRDPTSLNKPSSYPIPDVNMLGKLPGTRIHYGLLFGLIACVIAYFLIQRTTFGFAARTAGGNIRAARVAGLPVGKLTIAICFLAGACAGIAGMVEVAAVHQRLSESLVANYGYSGILVAFIARHNPLAAAFVAVLLGGILTSGGILQRVHELPDATVLVFQGLVFLVVMYSDSLYGKFNIFKESFAPAPPTKPGGTSSAVAT